LEVVHTVLRHSSPLELCGRFLRLFDKQGSVASNEELRRRFHANIRFSISNFEFEKIPSSPVAYWASDTALDIFEHNAGISQTADSKQGSTIGDNESYLRLWFEISSQPVPKWKRTVKGGDFRKWYGNHLYVVNWGVDGADIRSTGRATIRNAKFLFKPGVEWGRITISDSSFRILPKGFFHESASGLAFPETDSIALVLGFLNSRVAQYFLRILNPTLSSQSGDISRIPYKQLNVPHFTLKLVDLSEADWNTYEHSWNFQSLPLLTASSESTPTLESSYTAWITKNRQTIAEMQRLEEENNRLFIEAYGLQDELTPEVPIEQITLTVNPAYRYGKKEEQWSVESGFSEKLETRFREDTMKELISYAIGCMMGRYSLDEPGLIYAHAGNEDFDLSRFQTFPADDDGIVPITDMDWFDDDAANRVHEFLIAVWGAETIDENMEFLAENLGKKSSETPEDTIRCFPAARPKHSSALCTCTATTNQLCRVCVTNTLFPYKVSMPPVPIIYPTRSTKPPVPRHKRNCKKNSTTSRKTNRTHQIR